MQRYVSCMALALACALLVGAGSFQSAAFAFPKGDKPAKGKVKPRGAVPKIFGALDLSEDQKNKIFDVQDKYKDQIKALQDQLKELRAKEEKEIEEVLTPEQKTKLQEIHDAAKKAMEAKRAEKKAGKKVEKKADEKPEEPKK